MLPGAPRSIVWRRAGLALLFVVMAALAARGAFRLGNDFEAFHRSGGRFLAGQDLYRYGNLMPYRYLPGVTVIFAPFSWLSFPAAKAAWAVFTAALAFLSALWLDRKVGARSALAVPLAWLCVLQPFFQELSHGQADVLVLVLALAAFAAEERGSELTAGALVMFATALKIAPAILALDWVVRRRWRALAGIAVGAGLLAILPIPTYGLAGTLRQHVQWFTVQFSDIQVRGLEPANQSLWSMSQELGLGFPGGALFTGALLGLVLRTKNLELRRLLLLACVPLASGYGWPQGFVVAVPLLAELLSGGGPAAWCAGAFAAGVSILSYDIAGIRAEAWAHAHRVLGLLLLGVVVVGCIAARRAAVGGGSPDRAANAPA